MSGIPSDIAGSALQAGFVQREASRSGDAVRSGQAHAGERQLRAVDNATGSVETSDNDTQVFADAEGAGGQGRMFNEESQEELENEDNRNESAEPPDGAMHLDVQA
ncbi:MAG: hypothetical protein KAV82_08465 [Phycisphaerae bacterium]|nr:hypothetical protein [Phycisphaerae bacterium]